MPQRKKRKGRNAAQKKAAAAKQEEVVLSTENAATSMANIYNAQEIEGIKSPRSATGVLASHPLSRDVHIDSFSLTFHGNVLVEDTKIILNYGRRYGLIGLNGSGKSTILQTIGLREVPIPTHIGMYILQKEVDATDDSAIECVMSALKKEIERLEAEADRLMSTPEGAESDRVQQIFDHIYEDLNIDTAEKRAAEILHGLGFTKEMQQKRAKDFSGGWRMRISLARALFVQPNLLILDEPTNHLDLEACVWLEEYLKHFKHCLVVVSHSQDFLNGVCTNIIHLQQKKLIYYTGNFDAFVKTRSELEENQMKRYKWEQDQIANMKNYIARFGHGSAKLAKQAQSKEKALEKMTRNLTEKVYVDKTLSFYFYSCGELAPPIIQFTNVSFGYKLENGDSGPLLYKNLDLGVDLDSRIALVGPNGAGKSTLVKLMAGVLTPTNGMVSKHHHLRIGRFHQHLVDQLAFELSPLEFMLREFPDDVGEKGMRSVIGRFGLSGKEQVTPIQNLSDGQKSRVVFAWITYQNPHLLLLDEPTNHLDIETIDALADAINNFDGGLVLVSHDFRLINQVAKEIWICEKGTVSKWEGDILEYKNLLRREMGL